MRRRRPFVFDELILLEIRKIATAIYLAPLQAADDTRIYSAVAAAFLCPFYLSPRLCSGFVFHHSPPTFFPLLSLHTATRKLFHTLCAVIPHDFSMDWTLSRGRIYYIYYIITHNKLLIQLPNSFLGAPTGRNILCTTTVLHYTIVGAVGGQIKFSAAINSVTCRLDSRYIVYPRARARLQAATYSQSVCGGVGLGTRIEEP